MDSKDGSTWAERFWSKVDRSGGPDACHPWKTGRFPSGHGQFWLGTSSQMAHRCAFFLVHGRWPEPCGLHRCDNPTQKELAARFGVSLPTVNQVISGRVWGHV